MFYLLLALTVVFCLFSFFFLRWNQTKNYWAHRDVPHLPPNPILGSLNFIQRQNAGVWFRDMYHRFKAPYIGIWLIWKPALIVNAPELARRILVKDSPIFRDRYVSSGTTDPLGALNLFTVNDPIWTNVRRKLTSLFTSAKLRAHHDYTYLKAKELVQRVDRDHEKGLELKALFVDYTTDVTGTFAFGIESDATLTSKGPFREVTNDFMKFSIYRGLCWFSIFFCPELVDVFRFTFYSKSSADFFRKIFQTVMTQRSNNTKNGESKDLIDSLIEIKKESEKNNEGKPLHIKTDLPILIYGFVKKTKKKVHKNMLSQLSEDFLISQAAILLFGGFDTTASNLSYMMYELAFNSACQEKLYKELKEAKGKTGGHFDAQSLSDLTYLNCVFKEILRKYPPMGWLDRVASEDYRIDKKLTIKAGTVIYVNSIGMHHDPDYFPEPYKFNPDRFLPENEKNIKPYTFLPFGDGPRICIGQKFSSMAARTAASQLLLKYEVRPLPNTPPPNDVKIGCKGLLLHPGEPLHVEFIPRTENA